MSIIEQIKTKIKKWIYSIENCPFIEAEFGASERRDGELIAYKDVLSFLDSLESEKPMDQEGLEEEYKDYVESDPVYSKLVNRNAGLSIAHHFAEWGAKHLANARKTLSNDLEEASKKWSKENTRGFVLKDKTTRYVGDTIDAFIAGAKWQKQHDAELIEIAYNDGITIGMTKQKNQMLKEAMEGEAHPDDCEIWVNLIGYGLNIKDGEKVRVIVLNAEEE